MYCSLYIVKYPKWFGWAGFLSMALFIPFLAWQKQIRFYKLMGSGKGGSFSIMPDFRQWALLIVYPAQPALIPLPKFVHRYWRLFKGVITHYQLEPIEGHGTWDKQYCFGSLPKNTDYEGEIAVLTRATIRLSRLKSFWRHVDSAAAPMQSCEGFINSYGIGEVPFIKQATFSIWQSKQSMKYFAYKMRNHQEVIQKTRKENWYSEEMFTRFRVLKCEVNMN